MKNKHEHDFTDWELTAWAHLKTRHCKLCPYTQKEYMPPEQEQ